jgi:hypothetical protein
MQTFDIVVFRSGPAGEGARLGIAAKNHRQRA